MKELIGFISCYSYIGMILISSKRFQKYGEEYSRKYVHILSANWWLWVLVFFDKPLWPLLMSLGFLVVNSIAYYTGWFKQIQLKERQSGKGTIYYSLTMIILTGFSFYFNDLSIGLLGCLVLGYSDGLAALAGKKYPRYPYKIGHNTKTVSGSSVFFICTFIAVLISLGYSHRAIDWSLAFQIAGVATFLEAFSSSGRDNLWVPNAAVIMYIIKFW